MEERHYNSPQGVIKKQNTSAKGSVRTYSIYRTFFSLATTIIFLLSSISYSQTIKVVKDESDLGRGQFVTATQMFGIDIVVEGVKNCTGASFELLYDAADVVVYSNYKARDLGSSGISVINRSDSARRTGRIIVGVLSGIVAGQRGIDTPTVIHLDFVVLPSAKNGRVFTFTFVNPRINTSDIIGQVPVPTWQPLPMTINGFVTVYPGDANNDRIVNTLDIDVVGDYMGQGSGNSNIRGFKRDPASTLWLPQTALVWDSSGVTYADCDGSGDVTQSDQLVVSLNFDKTYGIQQPKGDKVQSTSSDDYVYSSDDTRFTFSTQLQRNVKAVASQWRVKLRNPHNLNERVFLGFTPDWRYTSGVCLYKAFHPDPNDMYSGVLYITFGAGSNGNINSGVLGDLHLPNELGSNIESLQMGQATAITNGGTIFNVGAVSLKANSTSSVDNEEPAQTISVSPQPCNEVVHISHNGSQPRTLQIVNTLGEVLSTYHVESGELTINIAHLPIGIYTLSFSNTTNPDSQRVPMVVVR